MQTVKIILLSLIIFCFSNESFAICHYWCEEDDSCVMSEGSRGIVKPPHKCKYALALGSARKFSELRAVTRGFSQRSEILVCCPISVVKCHGFGQRPLEPPPMIGQHLHGGADAKIGEFPYFAAIGYQDFADSPFEFDCGGALISEQFVLTAAHCVRNEKKLPKVVRLGKTSLVDEVMDPFDPVDRVPIQISKHPNYHSLSRDHDIALIKLNETVLFDYFIFPACLPHPHQAPLELIVNGFGATQFNGRSVSHLQKGKVREVPILQCRKTFLDVYGAKLLISVTKLNQGITDNVICAKDSLVDTCQGDSGTGMIQMDAGVPYVYGVTSFGIGCASELPSFYTRVSKYLIWIENIMWP